MGGIWVFMEIEFESEEPIYLQIYNQIIKGISRGELEDGEELPSVRQLSSDIGVDKNTVNKAYGLLKQMGIITTHRRKGAVIAGKERRILTDYIKKKIKNEMDVLIATGLCFQVSKEEVMSMVKSLIDKY